MSVNSYLSDLGSNLVLSSAEKDRISISISTIKSRLNIYFGSDIEEITIFGSYSRDTILPRKSDDASDVDVMVVFKNPSNYKPQSFLNRLKAFAEYYYSTSEIYQSSPTIVLELNHIKFELVPAYQLCGLHFIPNGPSDWLYTNPSELCQKVVDSNKLNSYMIKPVIRIIKHWNVQKNYKSLASYKLEDVIATDLKCAYLNCSSYTQYVKKALQAIRQHTDTARVDSAINHLDKAIDYENKGYAYSALAEIQKAFPGV